MKNSVLIAIFVIVAVAIGIQITPSFKKGVAPIINPPPGVACTMEAKLCPDGSYVGRSGPQCQFTDCPDSPIVNPTPSGMKGTLSGDMTIGPICPVERVDNPCKPTPEMFAARKIYVYKSDKQTLVATMTPDANGKFSVSLPVGNYFVDMPHQGIGGASGLPITIVIKDKETVTLHIDVDTGIR